MKNNKSNVITPDIQNLLDKLKIASKIYRKAASRIHNQLIKDQLGLLAERKIMFLEGITSEFHQEKKASDDLKLIDRINLELDKALIELNHIILDHNEREVLNFCIKRENELITIYKQLVYNRSFYPFMEAIVVSQLDETRTLLTELKEIRDAFSIYRGDT